MEGKELAALVHRNFEELLEAWTARITERGPGALVFRRSSIRREDGKLRFEFWTMAEMRRRLRELGEFDEFVYGWLRTMKEVQGFGIVILGEADGTDEILFDWTERKTPHDTGNYTDAT